MFALSFCVYAVYASVVVKDIRLVSYEIQAERDRLHAENNALKASLKEKDTLISEQAKKIPEPKKATTLAEKNNNPCNVKKLGKGKRWQGQIGVDKFGHAIFKSPEWGVRAAALVLRSYSKEHGIHTVAGIVDRFCEKNKAPYIEHLCAELKVDTKENLDIIARMPEIVKAMIRFESGRDWPEMAATKEFLHDRFNVIILECVTLMHLFNHAFSCCVVT